MRAHLHHICGVAGDKEVPSIWRDMELVRTEAEGLALISQFFLTGMSACLSEFDRYADLLHISRPLFNFVKREDFTNYGNLPAFLLGNISG